MKIMFDDNDLLYWNLMLVLSTMFKNGIINKNDLIKADNYLAEKYKIGKGSLARVCVLETILR